MSQDEKERSSRGPQTIAEIGRFSCRAISLSVRIPVREKSAATTRQPPRASAIALRPVPAAISSALPRGSSGSISITDGSGSPGVASRCRSSHLARRSRFIRRARGSGRQRQRAPAAIKVRAHSSAVAPVVITSSINRMRRLATCAGRFTAKARLRFFAAFGAILHGLRRRRPNPDQCAQIERTAEPSCDGHREHRGLN